MAVGLILYIATILGIFLAGGVCVPFFCSKCRRIRRKVVVSWRSKNEIAIESFLDKYDSKIPKQYTYKEVKKMTNSFKKKLGQGGFGSVFLGKISDGRQVAVKILNDSNSNGEEFISEVASIGKTSHVNVVALLGFCSCGSKRALVYDFMPNGSLDKYISKMSPEVTLSWEKLYEIAVGIARGLEYLHCGCSTRIVHFDIKPHNILLDHDFCPKISDFGLAKLCPNKESIISVSGARGTIGYIAPEVFSRSFGVVSSKLDVYSYGMMILEMFGGKKNLIAVNTEEYSDTYFPQSIYMFLKQDNDIDEHIESHPRAEETIRKVLVVGLWCIQPLPQNRPSMSRVVEMLEGSVSELPLPPKPSLDFTSNFDFVSISLS